MSNRNHCGVIIKVVCYNKNTYIGMVSSNSFDIEGFKIGGRSEGKTGMMKEKVVEEPLKVVMVNSENKDAKRIWEICTPLTGHMKSIAIYDDM